MAKVDASKVTVTNFAPNIREQMLQRDQVAGVFGYVNTIAFSAKAMGMDPDKDLRFILFSDAGMDLYSNAIVASKKLAKEKPDVVKGMLRAINKALAETVANPEAAMDYVMKREPLLKRDIEKQRLIATLKMEMSHPEAKTLGIGDVDEARFKKSIDIVTETYGSPRKPAIEEIFVRTYLPAKSERMMKLF
jgi:NitT/TauT family transport system substrate-binding protein